MAIEDGISLRFQSVSGQANPVDEVDGGAFTAAGTGTVELVSQGGEFGWRVLNDNLTKSLQTNIDVRGREDGGGMTFALRYRVNDFGGSNFNYLAECSNQLRFGKLGNTDGRGRWGNAGQVTYADAELTGQFHTIVLKIACVNSGTDTNQMWWTQASRPNNSPDGTSSGFNAALSTIISNGQLKADAEDIIFYDFIIWDRELTDAEAASVADGIRTVLPPSGGSTPITFNGTIPNQTPSVNGEFRLDISSFFSGSETPFTYSITPPIAGVSMDGSEVVISQPVAGALPSNYTNIVVRGTDTATDTADSNGFDVTWDLSPWGETRQDIEDSKQTGAATDPFLTNDFDPVDLAADRFRYVITQQPSQGTLNLDSFSRGTFSGAPQGVYTATYEGFKNNVSYGTATLTFIVGSSFQSSWAIHSNQVVNYL